MNRQSKIENKNGSPGLGAAGVRDELNLSRPGRVSGARGRERVQHHAANYTRLRPSGKEIDDNAILDILLHSRLLQSTAQISELKTWPMRAIRSKLAQKFMQEAVDQAGFKIMNCRFPTCIFSNR
jgi:hypothetical protein